MQALIAPSVLACDFTRLADEIRAVDAAGADWHHMDVMDGHFVPNLTFGPDLVKAVKRISDTPQDVHLMISEPARYAEAFIEAGAAMLTFHIEAVPEPRALIARIRELGARPGLVVKPATPVDSVFPFLDVIDLVMIMTVEPGFTAQSFMPECVDKVAELRRRAGPEFDIEVDGGINPETAVLTARAGANVAVAGAAVYRSGDMAAAIRHIREAIDANLNLRP